MLFEELQASACVIVDSLAFEVVVYNEQPRLMVTDIKNPDYKAMFYLRDNALYMSVSSFRSTSREQDLLQAVRINERLLVDEVQNAKILPI